METNSNEKYTLDDIHGDIGHLVHLLDGSMTKILDVDHDSLESLDKHCLNRASAFCWIARDIAERVDGQFSNAGIAAKLTLSETVKAKIGAWQAAETRYRKEITLNPESDHDELWKAKESAEDAMIEAPCQSIEDIRAKVLIAMRDENVFGSIADCTWNGEHGLKIFLRSLMGAPPVDNGGN
ncbi:hypothetical protein [Rhizobium sp. SG741]|uniref:hypothetical protein n=1 Tax=Rhizobium sp. SG741 TaxID=2587114 RepID=UPI0014462D61|nr:hypothetical protein [Rhizobium sp. SG741]NKJ03446.1 hypothetical protein [Rhizobium sp. SG741]